MIGVKAMIKRLRVRDRVRARFIRHVTARVREEWAEVVELMGKSRMQERERAVLKRLMLRYWIEGVAENRSYQKTLTWLALPVGALFGVLSLFWAEHDWPDSSLGPTYSTISLIAFAIATFVIFISRSTYSPIFIFLMYPVAGAGLAVVLFNAPKPVIKIAGVVLDSVVVVWIGAFIYTVVADAMMRHLVWPHRARRLGLSLPWSDVIAASLGITLINLNLWKKPWRTTNDRSAVTRQLKRVSHQANLLRYRLRIMDADEDERAYVRRRCRQLQGRLAELQQEYLGVFDEASYREFVRKLTELAIAFAQHDFSSLENVQRVSSSKRALLLRNLRRRVLPAAFLFGFAFVLPYLPGGHSSDVSGIQVGLIAAAAFAALGFESDDSAQLSGAPPRSVGS